MHLPAFKMLGIIYAVTVFALPTVAAAKPPTPAQKQAVDRCFGVEKVTFAQMTAACTTVISNPGFSAQVRAGALYNRGAAASLKGQPKQALADFDAAIKLSPNFARAWQARGVLHVRQQRLDKGIADLTKAIELDPKSAVAYSNRANAYVAKRDPAKALPDFDKSIALNGSDPGTYSSRAAARFLAKNEKGALEDLDKAIDMNPRFIDAYLSRGIMYMMAKEKTKAKADFERVLALSPGNANAKRQLAELEKRGG